jgi:hypothetical protein
VIFEGIIVGLLSPPPVLRGVAIVRLEAPPAAAAAAVEEEEDEEEEEEEKGGTGGCRRW